MKPLTQGELEVMKILWEHGELKPSEIEEQIPRPMKNAAVRSVLLVLLEKGHVKRCKQGKAYFYKAVTKRDNVFQRMAKQIRDVFWNGSSAALIAHLIEHEELSKSDIEELQKIANRKLNETDPQ